MRLNNLLVIGLLFIACQPNKKEVQHLFDTKQFFTQQIAKLSKQNLTLRKHVAYNNLNDSLIINTEINWEKELRLFSEFDLAKPTNGKLFTVDTAYAENEIIITYKAIDSTQRIKHVLIELDKQYQVRAVNFSTAQQTNLFSSAQQLRYVVDSGFSIHNQQQTQLADEAVYNIEGVFIP
jgi:hypothetical protein